VSVLKLETAFGQTRLDPAKIVVNDIGDASHLTLLTGSYRSRRRPDAVVEAPVRI
jgi:hypothetical protein